MRSFWRSRSLPTSASDYGTSICISRCRVYAWRLDRCSALSSDAAASGKCWSLGFSPIWCIPASAHGCCGSSGIFGRFRRCKIDSRYIRYSIESMTDHISIAGNWRSRRNLGILTAVLTTLACLVAAYASTPPIFVPVNEQDTMIYRNFYEREVADNLSYRWTKSASSIALPQAGQPASATLHMGLRLPPSQAAVNVTLTANGHPLLTLPVVGGRHVVDLWVPATDLHGGDIRLDLRSSTWHSGDDPRLLGIAVTSVAWHGLGPILPPLQQIVVLPALVIALALL